MHAITHPHATPPVDPGFIGIDAMFPAQNKGPQGSDIHPIRAEYNVAPFGYELRTDWAVDAICGEAIKLTQVHGIPGSFWEIARAPAGSKAKLDGSRLVPDVSGLFVIACALPGNWRREILVAAFPPDALHLTVYPPNMGIERRMRLRAVLHDPNVTRESIVAGLEGPTIDLATLAGYVGKKRGAFSVE